MLRRFPFFVLLILAITPLAVLAQDCPALVEAALAATHDACAQTGRNQACYGSVQLEATPRDGVEVFTFVDPGDQVNIIDVQALRLSSMDEALKQWGVALMRVQANLPDTMPGQNVTFVLFGDVQLEPAAPAAPVTLEVTAANNANVRGTPSRDGAIVGSLAGGQSVTADGRSADGEWLHLQLADGAAGWVFAELVSASGDASTLPEMDASSSAAPADSGAVQAFYFKSGVGQTPCAEAPDGLLIQSPPGVERVSLTINGATLNIGSTAFLQAPPEGGEMAVSALAGIVQVQAGDAAQTVVQGAAVSVPLDEQGIASGAPSEPQPIDGAALSPSAAAFNTSGVIVPTYDDAAANPIIRQLVEAGLLDPLTADQPVKAIAADQLQAVTDAANAALAAQVSLPTSGVWLRLESVGSFEGACTSIGGYGDGGGVATSPDDPSNQGHICSLAGAPPQVFVNSSGYVWDDAAQTFAGETYVDSFDNSTNRRELRIMDDTHVEEIFTSESEDCLYTARTVWEFYEGGDLFTCAGQPQVINGQYEMDWRVTGRTCDAALLPTFTEVQVSGNTDTLRLDMNGEIYRLSGYGDGSYDYYVNDEGESSLNLQAQRRFVTDFNLSWYVSTPDGQYCDAKGVLTLVEASDDQPPPVPTRMPGQESEPAASAGSGTPVTAVTPQAGTYQAAWQSLGMDCPADQAEPVPTFTEAALTVTDAVLTLETADGSYTLDNIGGMYGWYAFDSNGAGVMLTFTEVELDYLKGMYLVSDGSTSCGMMLTLERAGD